VAYLILDSRDAAVTRSREGWEAVLGRKKKTEDVTEFLWGVSQEGKDGKCALYISTEVTRLTAEEQTKVVAELDVVNWPKDAEK
jgi:hypothetical protein